MKPLSGIRVLDLTHVLAGPCCTKMLRDAGADVIKIEFGEGDHYRHVEPFVNGESIFFIAMNAGKRSLSLNLKKTQGIEVFERLIRTADVLVENFRPGVVEKLGIGYKAMKKLNPKIIYCSISGYGQTGPYKDKPGFGLIAEAESGLMALTGDKNGPPLRTGTYLADFTSAHLALGAILLALIWRMNNSRGQYIDVSLLDSMVSLTGVFAAVTAAGLPLSRNGNNDQFSPSGSYKANDGYVIICCMGDRMYEGLRKALRLEHPLSSLDSLDPNEKIDVAESLRKRASEVIEKMSVAETIARLESHGVPCCRVAESIRDIMGNPQIMSRGMLLNAKNSRAGETLVIGTPYKMSDCILDPAVDAPHLGENTDKILAELGYSSDQIHNLKLDKIV